jgi:hypothetical protein
MVFSRNPPERFGRWLVGLGVGQECSSGFGFAASDDRGRGGQPSVQRGVKVNVDSVAGHV